MTSLVQRDFGSPRKRESTGSNASSYLLLLNSLATDLDCMLSELCTTPDSYERKTSKAKDNDDDDGDDDTDGKFDRVLASSA